MFEKIYQYRNQLLTFLITESLLMIFIGLAMGRIHLYIVYIYVVVNFIFVTGIIFRIIRDAEKETMTVSKALGKESKEAFDYGQVGLILFDENMIITWISDFFIERSINIVGQKVGVWLEDVYGTESNKLFNFTKDGVVFEAYVKFDERVVFVKDVTTNHLLQDEYNNTRPVIAYLTVDNYDEIILKLDEQEGIMLTSAIRKYISAWAGEYKMVIRRYRSESYIIMLNEESYQLMLKDKFNITSRIKKQTESLGIPITVSIGFGRQKDSLVELEDMATESLDLALSRGGDQVAVKTGDEKVKYYGASSDNPARNSKVRARVVGQTLKNLMIESSNVFVMGHEMSDFDSVAGSIGIMKIAMLYKKPVYVILNPQSTEEKAKVAVEQLIENGDYKNIIIHPKQYEDYLDERSLVIVVDNHQKDMSLAPGLIDDAKRIVVIDHHRRSEDYISNAEISYIEPAASSTTELVVELFAYQAGKVELTPLEATMMFGGILVDTNYFKVRTGARTFEAASILKSMGASVIRANELLQEAYIELKEKSKIIQSAEMIEENMLFAKTSEKVTQALLAKAANDLLNTRDIEATFVMGYVEEDVVSISARSKAKINVQMIMELMGGGGHFGLAATRVKGKDILEVETMLQEAIKKYLDERVDENEGHTIK